MLTIPPHCRGKLDQLTEHVAEWVAGDSASVLELLKQLLEDEPIAETFTVTRPDMVKSLVVIAICEMLERGERAKDPDDVLYLSVDERCELEELMDVLTQVKNAGVTDEQEAKLDAAIGTLANTLKI